MPDYHSIFDLLVRQISNGLNISGGSDKKGCRRKIVLFEKTRRARAATETFISNYSKIVKELPLIYGAVIEIEDEAEPEFISASESASSFIASIVDDDKAYITCLSRALMKAAGSEVIPWGVAEIGATRCRGSGKGIKVGVIDTGIDLTHPDLVKNIRGGVNTIDPYASFNDDNGHGTHVAGTICAANNGIGIRGVAPDVELYGIKAMNRNGSGYISDIIEGIQWCIDNGIRLINLSLETTANNPALRDAVRRAYENGVIMVAAAGNRGPEPDSIGYPAKYPETIAVSAMTKQHTIADFSSRGSEVDVIAPGAEIFSTWRGGSYRNQSGTSMAAPHVTGSLAVLMESMPSLTPRRAKQYVKLTARTLDGLSPEEQGAGLLNLESLEKEI